MLADTLSRLIEIDDDIKLPVEQEGHEFGYVPFEQLPPAQVTVTEEVIINEVNNLKIKIQHIDPVQKYLKIELPISNLKLKELQEQDRKINHLRKLWSENKLNKNIFAMENDILKKKVIECGLLYKPLIIPEILRECLLILAHDEQGHNRFKRTHSVLKTLYYWKGMKRHIQLYCRRCRTCARHNVQTQELQKEHFSAPPQPMEFIAMDLIGEFHPASSKGNRYALTAICMLTGFTFCIPLKSKKAEDVVTAHLNHICCIFGPSKKILTENGSEFKNKMWDEVFKRLKIEHRVTPIYSPQCNGRIEGFHRFLKACIGKQLQQGLEWDDLVWKATAAYNFFPTESSGFSPFFLMYGHEANAKHMILAEETTKYLGDNEGVLNIQLMMKLLQVVAYNLAKSRTARDGNRLKRKNFRPRHIKINHPVLVRNHTAKPFEARSNDYICIGFEGNNRILVKDNHGKITKVNRKDVTPIEMDIKIAEFFKESRQNSKIRDAQLAMPTGRIPDLDWKFDEDIQLVEPVHEQVYSLEQTQEKEQPITPSPAAAAMEKETQPVQPAEEVTTEAIVLEAVQTPKIEECQTTPQTPIVSRFLSVLKPVAATVT